MPHVPGNSILRTVYIQVIILFTCKYMILGIIYFTSKRIFLPEKMLVSHISSKKWCNTGLFNMVKDYLLYELVCSYTEGIIVHIFERVLFVWIILIDLRYKTGLWSKALIFEGFYQTHQGVSLNTISCTLYEAKNDTL